MITCSVALTNTVTLFFTLYYFILFIVKVQMSIVLLYSLYYNDYDDLFFYEFKVKYLHLLSRHLAKGNAG